MLQQRFGFQKCELNSHPVSKKECDTAQADVGTNDAEKTDEDGESYELFHRVGECSGACDGKQEGPRTSANALSLDDYIRKCR